MTLLDRLQQVSALWCTLQSRSLSRLATMVVNDGKYFTRLDREGTDTGVNTIEKFARFFFEPGNWPEGSVPEQAVQFAHVTGIARQMAAASADNLPADIGQALSPSPANASAGAAADAPGSVIPMEHPLAGEALAGEGPA